MEDKTDYLNFIYSIDIPATGDFIDYFRIFTLLLQEEAEKGRWIDLKAENLTAYNNSFFNNTDLGSKIEYCYPHFKYEAGCRFTISKSTGCFSLFFILCPLCGKVAKSIVSKGFGELESNNYYDCGMCREREIYNSIYQTTERVITDIEEKYPNSVRIYNEMEEPIGVEIKLAGDYNEVFIQTCKYLDIFISILKKNRHIEVIERISFIQTELSDAFLPPSSSVSPFFKVFDRDSETIDEIYNKPHGIDGEYHSDEPPF